MKPRSLSATKPKVFRAILIEAARLPIEEVSDFLATLEPWIIEDSQLLTRLKDRYIYFERLINYLPTIIDSGAQQELLRMTLETLYSQAINRYAYNAAPQNRDALTEADRPALLEQRKMCEWILNIHQQHPDNYYYLRDDLQEIKKIDTRLEELDNLKQGQEEISPGGDKGVSKPRKERKKEEATLAAGVTLADVQNLLAKCLLGSTYKEPGEWAAALRALHVKHILTGKAPAMHRWAMERGYLIEKNYESIRVAWRGDGIDEASQLDSLTQRTVFRNVVSAAEKLLELKSKHS